MSFGSPLLLLALLAVPLAAAAYVFAQRRPARYPVAFTNLEVLAAVAGSTPPWRRWLPAAIGLLALTSLALAVARPRVTLSRPREQGTVILVVDVSRSMVARDVKPTRLGAAREAIRLFLDQVPPRFAVGIVAFSTEPEVVLPVTTDRNVARAAVSYLLPQFGTAIGDALARAVELGRASARGQRAAKEGGRPPPVSVLLLSDGAQRTGVLQPEQGAQRARAAGFRIYTVALGTRNGIVKLGFGPFSQTVPVPPDPATLKRISAITGGEFFAAPSADALKAAYRRLGSQVTTAPKRVEATVAFAAAGAGLLLTAGALSLFWSPRLP